MGRKVKVGGQWRDVKTKYRRVDGKWRQVAASYKKVNGVWRQVFAAQYPVGLYELNTDNLVGSYSLRFENGQYVAEINGYCNDPNRPVVVGFRIHGIPATRKLEYGFSAVASNVHAQFLVYINGSLESNMNGGSGGSSFFYAQSPVDIVYQVSATAATGAVSASFTIRGVTVDGAAI